MKKINFILKFNVDFNEEIRYSILNSDILNTLSLT